MNQGGGRRNAGKKSRNNIKLNNARYNIKRWTIPTNPPPNYANQPIFRRKIRYQSNALTPNAITITRRCILNSLVVGARNTGASEGNVTIMSSVRVRSLVAWGITSGSMLAVSWLGTNAPDRMSSDVGTVDKPAVISCKSPPHSRASEWINTTDTDLDTPLFEITCSIGTVIDLKIEFIPQDGVCLAYSGNFTFFTPPATALFVYTANLDNVTTANAPPGTQYFPAMFANGALNP